ncbi:hypothetical protein FM106_13835 [Brachybacterium faecium]|uniref:Uncharacterized protein n=1 Tax=Brochothrix thermosphacta TaxID=2756 RepID=A0A2X0QRW1_BROTH|nr:hypothetical protein FM106_13835 [Brachybacterium faecium]SPN76216.1 conserved hypothetical protein [Brochothrix thermosphacta]SPP26898.1 conserved hypothetical protein [Brochothrix thermosphacta]
MLNLNELIAGGFFYVSQFKTIFKNLILDNNFLYFDFNAIVNCC